MSYPDRTVYRAAFHDTDGLFLDDKEFSDDDKGARSSAKERGKAYVKFLNNKERDRLGGDVPDTEWFLAKVTVKVTEEWRQAVTKRRIVRKATFSSK